MRDRAGSGQSVHGLPRFESSAPGLWTSRYGAAGTQVPVVHVPAEKVGRPAADAPHLRRLRHADHSPERLDRNAAAGRILDRPVLEVDHENACEVGILVQLREELAADTLSGEARSSWTFPDSWLAAGEPAKSKRRIAAMVLDRFVLPRAVL